MIGDILAVHGEAIILPLILLLIVGSALTGLYFGLL